MINMHLLKLHAWAYGHGPGVNITNIFLVMFRTAIPAANVAKVTEGGHAILNVALNISHTVYVAAGHGYSTSDGASILGGPGWAGGRRFQGRGGGLHGSL